MQRRQFLTRARAVHVIAGGEAMLTTQLAVEQTELVRGLLGPF